MCFKVIIFHFYFVHLFTLSALLFNDAYGPFISNYAAHWSTSVIFKHAYKNQWHGTII